MFEIGSDKWPGISKLVEECGEVLQVCGKLMGAQGETAHWDGSDLRRELIDELGDVLAAIQFVVAYCNLDPREIAARADFKLTLFEKWHREQTTPRRKDTSPPPPLAVPRTSPAVVGSNGGPR